jgi:DNA-binding NarL/FixJ family response regulator
MNQGVVRGEERKCSKLIVVEDDPALRGFLKELFSRTDEFEVRGTFGCAEEALRFISVECPDLAFVDLNLPGMGGLELIRLIRARNPELQCVILTINDDIKHVWPAIRSGAVGYLVKPCSPARVVEAAKEAVAGGVPLSPGVARKVLHLASLASLPKRSSVAASETGGDPTIQLSSTERRVLELLAAGLNRKGIGNALAISIRTVSSHLASIYSKLHVNSQVKAALWYAAHAAQAGEAPPGASPGARKQGREPGAQRPGAAAPEEQ